MTQITRTSALTARHLDLGGDLQEYIRMGVPLTYNTAPEKEHDAIREAAGMYDFTAFLKFRVSGPQAVDALNHAVTFDVTKIKPGHSKYGPFLRETGVICDDGIVFNLGNDQWLACHGDGCARNMVELSAENRDCAVTYDDWTHLISLQGPKAVELLDRHASGDIAALDYFTHLNETELFGCRVMISRTGFSGERGYEIMCGPDQAVTIWDMILEHGRDMGILPCAVESVFPLRMEAGLLWRRFDLMENTPWEVNMGWVVDRNKADFRGKAALMAAEGKERFKLVGLDVDIQEALKGGETVFACGEEVGTVNDKPVWTHRMEKSLALARVTPEFKALGTKLEIRRDNGMCTAIVVKFPVYDIKTR